MTIVDKGTACPSVPDGYSSPQRPDGINTSQITIMDDNIAFPGIFNTGGSIHQRFIFCGANGQPFVIDGIDAGVPDEGDVFCFCIHLRENSVAPVDMYRNIQTASKIHISFVCTERSQCHITSDDDFDAFCVVWVGCCGNFHQNIAAQRGKIGVFVDIGNGFGVVPFAFFGVCYKAVCRVLRNHRSGMAGWMGIIVCICRNTAQFGFVCGRHEAVGRCRGIGKQ